MQPARTKVIHFLEAAGKARRRRLLAVRAASSLLVVSAALTTSLVVLLASPGFRDVVALALLSVTVVAVLSCLVPLFRRTDARDEARWIARQDPAFGGALADAAEFAERLAQGGGLSGSPVLAQAHVEHVSERLGPHDADRLARRAVPRLGGWPAAAAAAVASIAVVVLHAPADLLVRGPQASSAQRGPQYETVELTYEYPAYLDRAPRVEEGSGDVEAPVGTRVTVRLTADRPLRAARLEAEAMGAIDMRVDGRTAEGQVVVLRDDTYRIQLHGTGGGASPDSPAHVIRAVPDEAPRVRLVAPAGDVELAAGETLDLEYRVSDDHGIAAVVLLVEPDDTPEGEGDPASSPGATRPLDSFAPPVPARTSTRELSAEDLALPAGGFVWLSVAARDGDEISGPKWARSRRVRVGLRSGEQDREQLDHAQEEIAERLLGLLGSHLVADPARVADSRAVLTHHEAFAGGVSDVLELFPPALLSLQAGPEQDHAAWTALDAMKSRLDDLLTARSDRVESTTRASGDLAKALASLHPDEIEELERDVLFFDMWADRRSVVRALDAGSELLERVDRLREILAKEGEKLEGAERAALESELSALERALDGAADALGKAPPSSPEGEAEGKERAGANARARMKGRLAKMREAVAAGDRDAARRHAQGLAEDAESIAGEIASLADEGGMGDPELDAEIRELRKRLSSLRGRQSDLRDRTNELRDAALDQLSQDDRRAIEALFEELAALTDEAVALEARGETGLAEAPALSGFFDRLAEREALEQRMRDIETRASSQPGAMSADDAGLLERLLGEHRRLVLDDLAFSGRVESLMRLAQGARDSLGRLRQVLGDRDLDAAFRPARVAKTHLDYLVEDLHAEPGSPLEQHAPPFEAAAAKADEILAKLEECAEQSRRASETAMTAAQRTQMMQLGLEQAAMRREARDVLARLRELGADAPFLDEEAGAAVGRAAEHMEGAEQELYGSRPGAASEEQGEALASLEEASKALSPQPSKKQGVRREGRRGATSREVVEIPDADAYRVPREFREAILEAMRESSPPDGYEQQVREYYRRLVE